MHSDQIAVARSAGLRYVNDGEPGGRRVRSGEGFRYLGPDGKAIRDPDAVRRIRALAIPPAWQDVWICRDSEGHLQATGRDARGRKQYRYHADWIAARGATQYDHVIEFGALLPRIRRRVARDLALPGLPREKILAAIVRLLDATYIRIGNEEYARENHSFGLTTLRDRHAEVHGERVTFEFRGKSGQHHVVSVRDRRIARIIKRCQDLPGHELFRYLDADGARHPIGSHDVNAYLRDASHSDVTAKDFRTWGGTVLAAWALRDLGEYTSQTEATHQIVAAVEQVAKSLGNTPTVCRASYVHPEILNAHLDGSLIENLEHHAAEQLKGRMSGLSKQEVAVLAFLRRRLADASPGRRAPRSRVKVPA